MLCRSTRRGAPAQHQDRRKSVGPARGRSPCGDRPLRMWLRELLERDRGAGAFELRLRLLGRLLAGLLQDRLGGAVDQVLGLLQAQAGQRPDLLDDLDLLVAGGLQDDVELVLLLDLRRLGRRAARSRGGDGDRRGRGDAEGVLELLHELRQLEQRHLLERVEQLVVAELRHDRRCPLSVCRNAGGWNRYWAAGSAVSADCRFSCRAAARRATCDSGAWNRPAARDSDACSTPAVLASSTSRDSRSASRRTSSADSAFPSSTPPLITNVGLARAKSRSPRAASTGSPETNAIAVGPASRSSEIG